MSIEIESGARTGNRPRGTMEGADRAVRFPQLVVGERPGRGVTAGARPRNVRYREFLVPETDTPECRRARAVAGPRPRDPARCAVTTRRRARTARPPTA